MKREDFIDITKEHVVTAEKLLKRGSCSDYVCLNSPCPFHSRNNPNKDSCLGRYCEFVATEVYDEKLVESCKEFIHKFGEYANEVLVSSSLNDNDIDFLLDKYDFHQNNLMCVEELAELQQAISKVLRNKEGSRDNLIEEMSDVIIVIKMLQRLHNVSSSTLREEVDNKMKRNITRANK